MIIIFRNLDIGGIMLKKSSTRGLVLSAALVAASLVFSSCSNKITEEQLAQLKDLRLKERSLNESIQKKRDEKSRLEKELSARKAELKDCNDKKAFVTGKLQSWPNVWPE